MILAPAAFVTAPPSASAHLRASSASAVSNTDRQLATDAPASHQAVPADNAVQRLLDSEAHMARAKPSLSSRHRRLAPTTPSRCSSATALTGMKWAE